MQQLQVDQAAYAPPPGPRSAAALTYAPGRPGRRRRLARRLILAVTLLALAGALAWWREPLAAHTRLLYWQHACSVWQFHPASVVASSGGRPRVTAAPLPACWAAYDAQALLLPTARSSGSRSGFLQTVVFLHHLKSPAGHGRIVAVRCIPNYLSSATVVQAMEPVVVEPASAWPLSSRPVLHEAGFIGGYPINVAVQVFGGQADPADPSHFSIAYTAGGLPGALDGWLRDDDTVTLQLRPGSADVLTARHRRG